MSDYLPLIPLFVFVAVVLYRSRVFSKMIKYISFGYFFVVTLVFIIVRERISDLYEHPPIPNEYWEKNSDWSDIGLFLYVVPTAILFLTLCFALFNREHHIIGKIVILIFLAGGLAFLFAYAFYFSMTLGYRP